MDIDTDQEEHSIEMHLPYLKYIIDSRKIQIVPVLVGAIDISQQRLYGRILSEYFADPETLVVTSSDFCHWGNRFSYYYLPPDSLNVGKKVCDCIKDLDHRAMSVISHLEPDLFSKYLGETDNTICGRYPIAVILQALHHLRVAKNCQAGITFTHYAQSNPALTKRDSSVSYASALISLDL